MRATSLDGFHACFQFHVLLSVLVSINLSTHSVCSFGNYDTGINLQHFQWETDLFFRLSLHIITFLFASRLRCDNLRLFKSYTRPDSAVNLFILILRDGSLQIYQWGLKRLFLQSGTSLLKKIAENILFSPGPLAEVKNTKERNNYTTRPPNCYKMPVQS